MIAGEAIADGVDGALVTADEDVEGRSIAADGGRDQRAIVERREVRGDAGAVAVSAATGAASCCSLPAIARVAGHGMRVCHTSTQ